VSNFLSIFGIYDYAARQALILTLVGMSIYVLLRAGIFAVPQVGFMAIGSYTTAVLTVKEGIAFPVALVCSVLAAGLVGMIVAVLLIRVNGIYLALATIGLSEMISATIINLGVTGGAQGLYGVPNRATDPWIVGVVIVAMIFLARLAASRFGLAMVMIREQPLVARHVGIDIRRYRVLLFGLSGVLAGLGGSLYVSLAGFATPGTYSFSLLTEVLATVVIGGMAYVAGPILGSVIIFGLPLAFSGLVNYTDVLDGCLIVLVIAVARNGLGGLIAAGAKRTLALAWRGRQPPWTRARTGAAEPAAGSSAAVAALPRADPGTAVDLSVSDVRKAFGGIQALDGISLGLRKGEVLGVIGPNGSGKTSLLNVLSGAYHPDQGTGTLSGTDLSALWGRPERLARLGIARTFQGIQLVQDMSVLDNVRMGAISFQRASFISSLLGLPAARKEARALRERALRVLDELGMRDQAGTPVGELPYGAQRKTEIGRALMADPAVLMLDEPTAGMTPVERDEIFDLVQILRRRDLAVIVVEHDVEVMVRHCDRMVVLNFGAEIASGLPDTVIHEEAVIDAYIGTAS
jgi:ABC-type branched-subunit amino acid transport system ATPase component/ABC-type branched-subunit amino acid transport system permease subunit